MKKIIALVLALVMVLSLATVAFAAGTPWIYFKDNTSITDNRIYNKDTDNSLARVLVNFLARVLGNEDPHYIGFYGLDQWGIVADHDDAVNDIADAVICTLHSVAAHISNTALSSHVEEAGEFLGNAIAFIFSVNGRGEIKQSAPI